MKPAAWVGLAIIIAALIFGANAFVKTLTPYVSFDQARTAAGKVQVMGKLDKKSIHYTAGKSLDFTLVDDSGNRLPVTFFASRPSNFEEAVQVTAIGRYSGGIFEADNLLVKCPSKYQGTETERHYAKPAALQ
jgi:cytochrome c-type biogenesis protein CcmE